MLHAYWRKLLSGLLKVGSLRLLLAKLSRMWRLSETVAAGLMRISSSRSLLVASSAMGGLPPPYSGSKGFSFRGEFGVALDRGEADASPDNVLMIRELLKPTFDPEWLDRRVDWEQMDPAGARRWLRRRLDGLKVSAWKEEQGRKNGELRYELEWEAVEAITSDVPELEFVEFELREDERVLYEQLRGVLPEQQY
jgi:hypothetical protein